MPMGQLWPPQNQSKKSYTKQLINLKCLVCMGKPQISTLLCWPCHCSVNMYLLLIAWINQWKLIFTIQILVIAINIAHLERGYFQFSLEQTMCMSCHAGYVHRCLYSGSYTETEEVIRSKRLPWVHGVTVTTRQSFILENKIDSHRDNTRLLIQLKEKWNVIHVTCCG